MGKEFGSFRKATFGGFNRRDVINYIEKMRNESFEYKKQVEETVESLNIKIRELENAARLMEHSAVSENSSKSDSLSAEYCSDIGQATKHLKVVADELCRSLGDFMSKLNERGLFDFVEEPEQEEAALPTEEAVSLVDGILASISYLGKAESLYEKKEAKKEIVKETDVSEILSGYSFIR